MPGRWASEGVRPRPDRDTVPVIECEHDWCAQPPTAGRPQAESVTLTYRGQSLRFCSLGCASRWAIRTELRASPPLPPAVVAPLPHVASATPGEVRDWGRTRGWSSLSNFGRIPRDLAEAYEKAHADA